jgi:hypothetical protein
VVVVDVLAELSGGGARGGSRMATCRDATIAPTARRIAATT